jgi:DNA-binding transcriptional LysR family regulator
MKITNTQLKLLLKIAEMGSVGAAARILGLTQSGASQAIASLEKALGTELLTRTHHGVTPTAFAHSILPDAAIAVAAVQRIVDSRCVVPPSGSLRLASIPSIAGSLVPQWRRRFRQLYPQADIGVFEGNHGDINTWVAQGIADIGVTSIRPAELSAEHLGCEELLVVGLRDDPLIRREAIPLAFLGDRPMILASGCGPVVSALFRERSIEPPRGVETQSMASALEMVRQGLGLTMFSEMAFPRAGMEGLRVRPLAPAAYRDLYLVFRSRGRPSDAVSCFLNVAMSNEHGFAHKLC